MEAAEPGKLEDLELDPSLLYLFVAGPGKGEGLALRVPGFGWVAVDGCATERKDATRTHFSLLALLRRYGAEELALLVFTHPHADHAAGIPELIENLRPTRVAVTGLEHPKPSLLTQHELLRARGASETATRQKNRAVTQALNAILEWSDGDERRALGMHEGAVLATYPEGNITARAPTAAYLEALWSKERTNGALSEDPNQLSGVLEVEFGATRIVLGGDLPNAARGSETPLEYGWQRVLEERPELTAHHGLKVPHHGSREALNRRLLSNAAGLGASWSLSPFNSSGLPRTDDEDGLDILLEHNQPVLVTAMSASRKYQQARIDGRVDRQTLGQQTRRAKKRKSFDAGDTLVRDAVAHEPLDPVWAVAFDTQGQGRGLWRGRAALMVHRGAAD